MSLESMHSHIGDAGIKALGYGRQGFSCSEAIMLAFEGHTKLEPDTAAKLASGLGGGVGLTGEVCGAVLAACLVIGISQGTAIPKESYLRQRTYLTVQEYLARFEGRFGAIVCRDLCYSRLGPNKDFSKLRELSLVSEIIGGAADLLDGLLEQQEDAA